ncbi:chemotaxis protein CheB [Undibacterium sp. TJN25]|uniref:chemotaxis protein CheB n=1 Tax=Undibacterium sp. TJN25 TaxID=3413056 RepID=UPI003BEF7378
MENEIQLIAIGASAGGVEALGILLQALPPDCGCAVAIVLHMPPDRSSLLPELYQPRCALRIKEVEDKEPVQAGTVYFAAPNYHMLIEPDFTFSLSMDAPGNYSRPAIDFLLDSAVHAYRQRMLAIILTGASIDGAAGLKEVRARGGLGWVQDPQQAASPVMPAAAIALAGADRIMSLAEMAADLAAWKNNIPKTYK